jgi:hypothetical protein
VGCVKRVGLVWSRDPLFESSGERRHQIIPSTHEMAAAM